MKKVVLNVVAFIAAAIAWAVTYLLIYWVITLLASIPIIGTILYWPSDSMIARTVSSIMASVVIGAFVSVKICKNAKLFCGALIALNLFAIVKALMASTLGFSSLLECGLFILTAGICWKLDEKAINE